MISVGRGKGPAGSGGYTVWRIADWPDEPGRGAASQKSQPGQPRITSLEKESSHGAQMVILDVSVVGPGVGPGPVGSVQPRCVPVPLLASSRGSDTAGAYSCSGDPGADGCPGYPYPTVANCRRSNGDGRATFADGCGRDANQSRSGRDGGPDDRPGLSHRRGG
jgi:hypothetical protein